MERNRRLFNIDASRKTDQLKFFGENKKEGPTVLNSDTPKEEKKTKTNGDANESGVPILAGRHNTREVLASNKQNETTRDNKRQDQEAA